MYFDAHRCSLVTVLVIAFVGCGTTTGPTTTPPVNTTGNATSPPSPDEIKRQLDDALDFTYTRRLDTKVNAAWQIIHGCIAYKQEFLIRHNGQDVRAIEFLFGGGTVEGWEFEPGMVLDPATGRRGLRAIPRPGSNRGQGHEDQ